MQAMPAGWHTSNHQPENVMGTEQIDGAFMILAAVLGRVLLAFVIVLSLPAARRWLRGAKNRRLLHGLLSQRSAGL